MMAAPRVDRQLGALAGLIVIEIVIFSMTGTNFLGVDNAFETLRLTLEIAFLAVALTPVITTGGIDLSVGSLMALCAILFGKLFRDAHWPVWWAAAAAVGIGGMAGLLNALLITRLRINPLIVTLGSFSLFRGLAEGITRAVDNFTNFPKSFTWIGDRYFFHIPAQLLVFIPFAVFFFLLQHRSIIGRSLVAIGFSPQGARHAGIPIERRLTLVYVLSGLSAGLAAIIYVARADQAKADAATGYELQAITAVVLGGTSIFGGRGTVVGTILGWLAIAILKQGLALSLSNAAQEVTGILTGGLLIVTIAANAALASFATRRAVAQYVPSKELP
jgi:ribose/xylose/arabinose/galactoside ABC-type transport system permease subunit